ncbi:hypothetical protein VPHK406_0110 [Vibrio phage K406]
MTEITDKYKVVAYTYLDLTEQLNIKQGIKLCAT